MVKFGAINALGKIMHHLGRPTQVIDDSVEADEKKQRTRVPSGPFRSKADYVLLGRQGKVLVAVEAPSILDLISSAFEPLSRPIDMTEDQPLSNTMINKARSLA